MGMFTLVPPYALAPFGACSQACTRMHLLQARLACEDIVGPLQQQAELLPRTPAVIQVGNCSSCHSTVCRVDGRRKGSRRSMLGSQTGGPRRMERCSSSSEGMQGRKMKRGPSGMQLCHRDCC